MVKKDVEFKSHKSISSLYQSMEMPLEDKGNFTIHFLPDLHQELPFNSPVFRSEYFSFVFVKNGSGKYSIDEKEYKVAPNTIYFTNPGHLKSFEITSCEDAYLVGFTESYLRENILSDIFLDVPFLLAETIPPAHLEKEKYSEFEAIYHLIYQEFKGDSVDKNKIIGNLAMALLLKLKMVFRLNYNPLLEGNSNSQIVTAFKTLLENEFQKINANQTTKPLTQVLEYADKLNIHPSYLSTLIKNKTGKSVGEWIKDRNLSAAKALLKNTSLSSKEIAHRLGFSEPTHFSRFFKTITGISPKEYKKTV